MDNLFELNDTLMYGSHGVCTLSEITERDFGGEAKNYYVLHPAYSGSSTFYVPTDSEVLTAKMRHVKNAAEIRTMLRGCAGETMDWVDEDRPRQNHLKQVVDSGDTTALVRAMKTLYQHQQELLTEGKKLRAADDRFMKDIEKLLLDEFSIVFDVEHDNLIPFLLCESEPTERN